MTDRSEAQQQYEGTRLAAAAYAAKDVQTLLSHAPSQHELTAGMHSALVNIGFSVEQANNFVEKYTPVAALDQDGAGTVLFRVNGTNQIATAVRGTEELLNDLALADGTIAQGELPVYQTTLIANFVLRETTPAGQPVPQFSVQGGDSNAADLARATADSLANAGGEKGNAPNLVTMPVIVQTGTVMGTGNAVGPCVDAAAHSEGSPEITTLGSAIAQCSRITTVNGPGVSVEQMQSVSDQIATPAGRQQQDIASQNQLNIHTTHLSVTDGLNGGLPGDQSTLSISDTGLIKNHSSIVAMNAAEAQYKASLGEGVTDMGVVEITAPRPTLENYLDSQGSALSAAQQTALAAQIDSLGLGGEGDLSFYTLPNGSVLIANADGDIVGEINHSQSGGLNLSATGLDANGNTVEVNNHIGESGDVQTQVQYNAQVQAQANASVNLFNSLMAAQQWNQLDDMGKLSVLVNVYSAADTLGGNLPGDLGGLASVLSLMQGLESGNDLLVLRSSLQLGAMGLDAYSDYMSDLALQMADDLMASATVDAASSAAMDAAAEAALESAAASNAAGSAVPYVSYVMALQNFEDHPEQSAGTVIGTYIGQSIGYSIGGPIGAAIGGAIGGLIGGTIGGMFGDDDIPMREGLAHAQWDESGHTQVVTTQDAEGGGATANAWMAGLVNGLQDNLDQHTDANGQPQYGLVPDLLPSVGFKYDPDGFNLANGASGFMYLEWTDESGQTQTRYYDGAGNRGDGSGETLAGDFMQHALDAIAPAWQVQTALAHYQQSGQIELPAQTQNLPAQLEDGLHQTVQVLTLELGSALPTEVAPNSRWIDVDADGYLEQTQWAQANQAMLAVDLNGDGQIGLPLNLNATNLDKQAANDKFFRSAA